MSKWITSLPLALLTLPLMTAPAAAVKPTSFYKKPAMKQMLKGYFSHRNRMAFLTEGYMTTVQRGRSAAAPRAPISNLNPIRQDYNVAVASQVQLKSIKIKSVSRGEWKLEAELGSPGHQGLERVRTLPVTVKGSSLERLRGEIKRAFAPSRTSLGSTPVVFE